MSQDGTRNARSQPTSGSKRKRAMAEARHEDVSHSSSESPLVTGVPPNLPDGRRTIRQKTFARGSLEDLRSQLADFAQEREWDQFHAPRNLLLAMMGEVGELAEIFQWKGDKACATGLESWSDAKLVHLGEELSDVLLYLIRLADKCNIDLFLAAKRKLCINGIKYPASQVKGRSAKYTEYKSEWRKKKE